MGFEISEFGEGVRVGFPWCAENAKKGGGGEECSAAEVGLATVAWSCCFICRYGCSGCVSDIRYVLSGERRH